MPSEPISISGVRGPVNVTTNPFTGKATVLVDGLPVERGRGGKYALPASDGGTVEAKVSSSFIQPFPSIEVAGVKHPTGPKLPIFLQVLMVLPLGLVFVGGLLGGLVGAIGVGANALIARGEQSMAIKALLMLLVLAAAVGVWFVAVAAITAAM